MIQKISGCLCTLIMLTVHSSISLAMDEKFLGPAQMHNKLKNFIGMEFVHVPPGNYLRGSPSDEPGREDNETLHQVVLTKGFFIQTTEITQKQWQAVMGGLPRYLRRCDANCPVDRISWNDAQNFIEKLNNLEKTHRYRLPTPTLQKLEGFRAKASRVKL